LILVLFPALACSCTNFGEFAFPEHAAIRRMEVQPGAELPPVRVPVGRVVEAVRYPGTGMPFPLWVTTEDTTLTRCVHVSASSPATTTVEGLRIGESQAYYTSFPPEESSPSLEALRKSLHSERDWLTTYREYREDRHRDAGQAGYLLRLQQWGHVLEMDIDRASPETLRRAWLRGMSEARFLLVIEAAK
jgi:hypothetical protein